MKKKRTTWASAQSNDLVYTACRLLLEENTATDSADAKADASEGEKKSRKGPGPVARVEMALKDLGYDDITREQIYPLLWEGVGRGYVTLLAPRDKQLGDRVCDRYGIDNGRRDRVVVVPTRGKRALEQVAREGANVIWEQIRRIAKESGKERIHLGFGGGNTSRSVAKMLAYVLRSKEDCPPITVRALTSGFLVEESTRCPSAFFNFFDTDRLDV